MSTTLNTPTAVDGTTLVDDHLFALLDARIRVEHPELPPGMPGRIMDQALAFLATCAVTTEPIGPSEAVDIGWHTFILYTPQYAAFCQKIAGRFIHHVPDDEPDLGPDAVVSPEPASLKTTVGAIRAAGYRLDLDLWPGIGVADCTQCHAGCHDSPGKK